MPIRYDIASTPQGWVVLEDGKPVEVHAEHALAVEVAELLATVCRALGRPAKVETLPN